MFPLVRNVLAVLAGVIVGGAVNSALIALSPSLIPPPPGVDVTSAESIRNAMPLFTPPHFVMPFLAHALGTLAGSLAAYLVAATRRTLIACLVGALFLCDGIIASMMIPAPEWFIALDLAAAYLPMAWLGAVLASRLAHRAGPARLTLA